MATATITFSDTHQPIPLEKGHPLLGCLPEMASDFLAFMKRLAHTYPDLVEFKMPIGSMALVTSAELCHQILVKEHQRFRKADRDVAIMGAVIGNGLVTNNNHANHKIHRKLVQPGFHFRRIEGYAKTMIEYTDRYLRDWPEQGERDINDDMFRLTMYIVSKTLFDTNMSVLENQSSSIGQSIAEFQAIADKQFKQVFLMPEWVPTPTNFKIKRIRKGLHDTISKMIESRRDANGEFETRDDLMSMLLSATYEDGSKMTENQIMDELVTLFVAGHETTTNALTWAFYLLAAHPEIQDNLNKEVDLAMTGQQPEFEDLEALKYTEMVIKEAMRMYPPAWTLNSRQPNEDVELGGYVIPKDTVIFVAPYANHYNPRYFPNPECFDPERFHPDNEKQLPRFAFMPFGGGPRVCIGNSFAMMEAKIVLATLARRYRFELVKGQRIQPQPQITLSNQGGMRLKFRKR